MQRTRVERANLAAASMDACMYGCVHVCKYLVVARRLLLLGGLFHDVKEGEAAGETHFSLWGRGRADERHLDRFDQSRHNAHHGSGCWLLLPSAPCLVC